jgi:hypothetical protein
LKGAAIGRPFFMDLPFSGNRLMISRFSNGLTPQLMNSNQCPADNHEDASHRGDGSEFSQGRGEDFIQRKNPKGYAENE